MNNDVRVDASIDSLVEEARILGSRIGRKKKQEGRPQKGTPTSCTTSNKNTSTRAYERVVVRPTSRQAVSRGRNPLAREPTRRPVKVVRRNISELAAPKIRRDEPDEYSYYRARHQGSGTDAILHAQGLYQQAEEARLAKEMARQHRLDEEDRECTFSPAICSKSRPAGTSSLYDREKEWMEERDTSRRKKRAGKMEENTARLDEECTFSPRINSPSGPRRTKKKTEGDKRRIGAKKRHDEEKFIQRMQRGREMHEAHWRAMNLRESANTVDPYHVPVRGVNAVNGDQPDTGGGDAPLHPAAEGLHGGAPATHRPEGAEEVTASSVGGATVRAPGSTGGRAASSRRESQVRRKRGPIKALQPRVALGSRGIFSGDVDEDDLETTPVDLRDWNH